MNWFLRNDVVHYTNEKNVDTGFRLCSVEKVDPHALGARIQFSDGYGRTWHETIRIPYTEVKHIHEEFLRGLKSE